MRFLVCFRTHTTVKLVGIMLLVTEQASNLFAIEVFVVEVLTDLTFFRSIFAASDGKHNDLKRLYQKH